MTPRENSGFRMIRRRWLWLTTIIGVVLIIGAGTIWLLVPPDPITVANCDRIKAGMSAAQIEDILGRKPDEILVVGGIELERIWIGRTGSIDVAFDVKGFVVSRMPFLSIGGDSFLDRLRSWLP